MKTKRKKPPLKLNPKDEMPPSLRVVLPNANGDAIGQNIDTDTGGVGIAMPGKKADMARYGVAYAPNGGTALAGAQGAAVVHSGGHADAGDGAMAYIYEGKATAFQWSAAYALRGDAAINRDGVAAVLLNGSATIAGRGGVACALNYKIEHDEMVTDPTAGTVSGGTGSVVVAFNVDRSGRRVPVVGFIGSRPGFLDDVLNLESQLRGRGAQFGLKANVPYRLNAETGQFEEA